VPEAVVERRDERGPVGVAQEVAARAEPHVRQPPKVDRDPRPPAADGEVGAAVAVALEPHRERSPREG
jgi:hypothetical protein